MATNKYTGAQKAAILLLSFGEEISGEIFKNMTEFESESDNVASDFAADLACFQLG